MFRPRCEHAIGLEASLRAQIIDEHPDIRLIALERHRRLSLNRAGGVDSCDQTLSGSFLVA